MTDDDECIHGLGPVSACTICNGKDRARAAEESWREFPAKYEGQCPACNLPIRVGDLIAWRPDDRPRHTECRP